MISAIRKCRVCGKEHEVCRSAKKVPGVFHWQEVACSPECGEEYLKRIIASRSGESATTTKSKRKKAAVEPVASAPIESVDEVADVVAQEEVVEQTDGDE